MSPRPRRNETASQFTGSHQGNGLETDRRIRAQALSLRAIGRSLRITAPAIYNYFPDRDALVTVLIIDAFNSFGQALEAARDALPKEDLAGRFSAGRLAYRNWAVTHPNTFCSSLVRRCPGMNLPKINWAGSHQQLPGLVGVLDEAQRAGALHPPEGYVRWTASPAGAGAGALRPAHRL